MPTDQNIRSASASEHQAPDAPTRHKGVSALVWIIVLLIFAGGFYLVLRKRDASATAAKSPRGGGGPVSLLTANARKGDIGVYLNGLGSVIPLNTVTVKSRVDGQLMQVRFKEGQTVRSGELLAEISRRGVAILLVEQKLAIALKISSRLYVMAHGRIVFQGKPDDFGANSAVRKEWLEV